MKLILKHTLNRRKLITKGLLNILLLTNPLPAWAIKTSMSVVSNRFHNHDSQFRILFWENYLGPLTERHFQESTNININIDYLEYSDDLLSIFESNPYSFDLVVVGGNSLQSLISEDKLHPLDKSKLTNIGNLFDIEFINYDKDYKYSIPYSWGTMGLVYNINAHPNTLPISWNYLYNSSEYNGRKSLIRSKHELIRLGLKALGYSINETNRKRLQEIEKIIINQKRHIKFFHNNSIVNYLKNNEIDLAQTYNGDIIWLLKRNNNFGFEIPIEGSIIWTDNLVIPKNAKNIDQAHKFINYILQADVAHKIYNNINYPTPNEKAFTLLSEEYKTNPAIFPDINKLKKCEIIEDLGPSYNDYINKMMSRILSA